MNRITRIAALAVLVMGVAATLQPANAICGSPRNFKSDSYIVTPGCEAIDCTAGSMTSEAQGVFWGIGDGDPTVGVGIDNGTFTFFGGNSWGIPYPGYPVLINSHWQRAGIDGCIDFAPGVRCMAILLSDTAQNTGSASPAGAFALMTDRPDDATVSFDFSEPGNADITLLTLPTLRITDSARTGGGTGVDLTVNGISAADIAGGLYLDPECPDLNANLILGYQVYTRSTPRGAGAPTDNDATNWTPAGPVVPLGSPSTFSLACDGETDKYITGGVVFDSAFANTWVSGQSLKVECGVNLADPENVNPTKPRSRELPRSRQR